MSQAEFGNPPEVVPTPHQTEQTKHEQEDWQQQLRDCDRKCEQAYMLLKEAQEKSEQSKCFEEQIARLESALADKCEQLEQSNARCEFLRTHLKREQKQVSQLKALLERFLDGEERADSVISSPTASASEPARKFKYEDLDNLEDVANLSQNITDTSVLSLPNDIAVELTTETQDSVPISIGNASSGIDGDISELPEREISALEQLASKLNLPLESRTSYFTEPSLPSLEAPAIEVSAYQSFNYPNPDRNQISDYANHLILPQVTTPQFMQAIGKATKPAGPAPLIDRARHRATKSLATVKLPEFPPLQRR